jgi:hypothetical protein
MQKVCIAFVAFVRRRSRFSYTEQPSFRKRLSRVASDRTQIAGQG